MEKNQFFSTESLESYIMQYGVTLQGALAAVPPGALRSAYARIAECAQRGGTVFVAGNGGSASVSEHLSCDFAKGAGLRVISLVSNTAQLTALANDEGYERIFAEKLRLHRACMRDLLILISSSGNSPNILCAMEYARKGSISVIGLSGFGGGRLRAECDVSLHISAENYGVCEDAHSVLMHCLTQWHHLAVPQSTQW